MSERNFPRRRFLLAAAGAGAGGAALLAARGKAAAAGRVASLGAPARAGYRITPHIARYYRTMKF